MLDNKNQAFDWSFLPTTDDQNLSEGLVTMRSMLMKNIPVILEKIIHEIQTKPKEYQSQQSFTSIDSSTAAKKPKIHIVDEELKKAREELKESKKLKKKDEENTIHAFENQGRIYPIIVDTNATNLIANLPPQIATGITTSINRFNNGFRSKFKQLHDYDPPMYRLSMTIKGFGGYRVLMEKGPEGYVINNIVKRSNSTYDR